MPRLPLFAAALFLTTMLAPAARAGDDQSLEISAALGGTVPHATGDGMFLVADLSGALSGALSGKLPDSLPFSLSSRPPGAPDSTNTVFDTRQEAALGARVPLGRLGQAKLSLGGTFLAAEKLPDQPRPLAGLLLHVDY